MQKQQQIMRNQAAAAAVATAILDLNNTILNWIGFRCVLDVNLICI